MLLAAAPTSIDELVRCSGLPAGTVSEILLELELSGRLQRHAGNAVALT
jgi:DNA processing protein